MDLSVLGCSMQKLFLLAAAQLKAEMLCDDLVGVVGGERWEVRGGRREVGGRLLVVTGAGPEICPPGPVTPLLSPPSDMNNGCSSSGQEVERQETAEDDRRDL